MTAKQKTFFKIQRSQSEKREQLSTLDTKTDRTNAETTQLETIDRELRELEPRFLAALVDVETEQSMANAS